MCNQSQAIAILGEVYMTCSPVLRNSIQDAYLYGSYARGDYDKESDIDILLTVNMTAEEISEVRRNVSMAASDLSLHYDITISIVIEPISRFDRYVNVLPYYKNVIKEGIRYAS